MRLSVANLERSLAFYCGLIGLERGDKTEGDIIVLYPGPHRRIVSDPPHRALSLHAARGHIGMYRFSFFFSRHGELARVARRFITMAYDIEGVFDYSATLVLYLHDPDGIPVELYVERPHSRRLSNRPPGATRQSVDLESFLRELR